MKTTTAQNHPIPPALFQIAARMDGPDSFQGLNRESVATHHEIPTSKPSAAHGIKITFRLAAPAAHSVKLAADLPIGKNPR